MVTGDQWVQVVCTVGPIVLGQWAASARDRARVHRRLTLLEKDSKATRRDVDELGRRQARHERDPAHITLRGHR